MNDNLSSMITPKNLVKNNLSRVMSLRIKGVVMLDHFIRAQWKIMKFDFFLYSMLVCWLQAKLLTLQVRY